MEKKKAKKEYFKIKRLNIHTDYSNSWTNENESEQILLNKTQK